MDGSRLAKKFTRPGKNSGYVGRTEEALEEENNSKLKKYFLSYSKKYWKNGRSQTKNSQDLAKTLEMMEEWKKLWKKKIIQSYRKYFHSFFKKILEEWKKLGKKFT